jgi:hypothetical protein
MLRILRGKKFIFINLSFSRTILWSEKKVFLSFYSRPPLKTCVLDKV